MVAQFVHVTITAVAANPTSLSFYDVEVALTLFYSMGDGIQGKSMTIDSYRRCHSQDSGGIFWKNVINTRC